MKCNACRPATDYTELPIAARAERGPASTFVRQKGRERSRAYHWIS